MKKLILSAVVAAAAVFGAYTANQTNDEIASLGLLNVVDLEAEASYGSSFEVISDTDIPLGIMHAKS